MLAEAAATPAALLVGEVADISTNQLDIHRAAGMVSVQLSISISDALARLRAEVYADGRSISSVAADIVTRRVRLDP